jgi:hypothetical protein
MRVARHYPEQQPANDPRTTRDAIYAELRNISEQAEKLGHRARIAAAKLAELPARVEDDAARRNADSIAASPMRHSARGAVDTPRTHQRPCQAIQMCNLELSITVVFLVDF